MSFLVWKKPEKYIPPVPVFERKRIINPLFSFLNTLKILKDFLFDFNDRRTHYTQKVVTIGAHEVVSEEACVFVVKNL